MARDRGLRPRRIVAMLRPYARGEAQTLLLGAATGVVAVLLHVARPWPLKWILDALTNAGLPRVLPDALNLRGSSGFVALGVLYVALSIGFAGASYAQQLLLNGAGNRVLYRFRTALFEHLLRRPLAFHESRDSGELLTRVIYDTSRLRRGVNGILLHLFQTLFLFAATLLVLVLVAPTLAAVVAAGGCAALLLMHRSGRRIAAATRRQRRKEGSVAALVSDELQSVREVQTFGPGASVAGARFRRKNGRSLAGEQLVRRLSAGMSAQVEIIFAATVAVTLALGAYLTAQGTLSAGDLVLFVSYAIALREPFAQFARQTARLGRVSACAERLGKLIRGSHGPSAASAPNMPPLRGDIAFEGLFVKTPSKTRNARKWALEDVSARIEAGQRVAIVGANGSGKSTLLRAVLRLATPRKGRVLIDGADLASLDAASLRSQGSVVFQDAVLFGLTVRENLLLGCPDASAHALRAAADAACATPFVERMPDGFDTPIRRRGTLLSPGERQRLVIARALLRDGRLWLLDEPMAGLDRATAATLTELLLRRTAGRTTLWVTHDPMVMERLDAVIELHAGALRFAGTTEDYLRRPHSVAFGAPSGAPTLLQES